MRKDSARLLPAVVLEGHLQREPVTTILELAQQGHQLCLRETTTCY
jgi:hypothetical protein